MLLAIIYPHLFVELSLAWSIVTRVIEVSGVFTTVLRAILLTPYQALQAHRALLCCIEGAEAGHQACCWKL